ncbi:MAG: MFS transporter, partial [Eubacteriales bacterium]
LNLMVHLMKRYRMSHNIVAAGIFYVLEMTLYSFAGNFAHLFFIITFQGIGGGLFIGVGTNYVYSLAPDHLKATAQTLNGAMNSVAGIVGNLLGGVLIAIRRKGLLFHSRLHDLRSCCPLPSQLPSGPADSQTAPSQCRPPSPRPAL